MTPRTRWFLNDPAAAVEEMLEGYAAVHRDKIRLEGGMVVRARPKEEGKVGVVIGNGSGHEPAMIGWVGEGLLDVNVPGPIFSSPGPAAIARGIRAADRGAGALLLVSSHAGDIINAEMAMAEAAATGVEAEMAVLYDDVASAPPERMEERRGGAGLFFAWKMIGAAAEEGRPLAECARVAEKVRANIRSISAAMGTVAHPVSGTPLGDPEQGALSVGMGVHGEPGTQVGEEVSADEIAELLTGRLADDLGLAAGDEAGTLLNNAGSLTLMELSVLHRGAAAALARRGAEAVRSWIGPYATTLDMTGFSLALCRMDEELLALYDAPADGAGFTMRGSGT